MQIFSFVSAISINKKWIFNLSIKQVDK